LLIRLALIEALDVLAAGVSKAQQIREAAYLWANRLAVSSRRGEDEFQRILTMLEQEPVALQPYFVTCLAKQLQDEEGALAPAHRWIEDRLEQPLNENCAERT